MVEEEEAKESHPDPSPQTRDVPFQGRGGDKVRETWGAISASLGAMRPLVEKLDKLLLDPPQGCSSNKVKEEMHLLKKDVEKLSSCLDELSEVEDPPPTARCWMNEVRDLSYKMEDYVDSLLFVPHGIKTTSPFRKVFSHAKTPKGEKQIAATVSEFRKYAKAAIRGRKIYVLSYSNTLRRRFVSLGPMLPTPHEDIVIDGRMNDFINSFAKNGDKQLSVVSILGSACLGKTTLARVLYNKLGKRYHCRAFIWVSRKPDMKRIFRDMLSQLQRQDPPEYRNELDLINNIKKYLRNKRYLIIIDDVWAASVWDIINHALPEGSHGSRIITTTQIEDVALTCCCYQSKLVFEMKPLDDYHSRKLFFNRLFGSESYCPEQFKEVLNKIVETCGGLPLATISIAGLLGSQPSMTEDLLKHIHGSLRSCFSASSTSERTIQALNLSFNNLPHYLKTCLLYLSMYPQGYTFCKDQLVKQWMAEGFIDTTIVQGMEKVAESYLHQLIGRRFIQPIHVNYNNEVLSCAVHDTVHDLIALKSVEDNFIVAIDDSPTNVDLSHKARRLSLLFGDARYAKTPANMRKAQVRTLTFFGLHECMPCITEFKLLSVLNLQLSHRGGDDNPLDLAGISELFRLRYLKIASDFCIKLPKHGLECLETLDIMDTKVVVDGGVPCVPYIHLPHLLHLSLSDGIDLVKWIYSLVFDGKLNYLQDLHITTSSTSTSNNVEFTMETLRSIIGSGHHKLKNIVVRRGSSVKNVVVRGDDELSNIWNDVILPPLLQRFEFVTDKRIVFSRIPPSIEKHGNLCILKIEVGDLEMSCVDILRGLPALTALSLYLKIAPFQRIMFVDKPGFSVLKYFKLRFATGIAWLKFEEGAMPNLWKLKLVFNAIPRMDVQQLVLFSNYRPYEHKRGTAVISIEHIPSLKEISVKFEGAAADVEYALRVGVSNHQCNPTINKQPVDYSCYDDERSKLKQQQSDEILVEEQDEYNQKQLDEYYKQQPDEILQEEPDEHHKQQPDDTLDEEPGECDKTFEGSANISISSSSDSSQRRHIPGMAFKRRLGCFGWEQKEGPRRPRKGKPTQLITRDSKYYYSTEKGEAWKDRAKWLEKNQRISRLAKKSVQSFTMSELMFATSNFSRSYVLGKSDRAINLRKHGFGRPGIYACSIDGSLPHKQVVINLGLSYHKTNMWLEEAVYLETKKHPNLVELVGFCNENLHKLLVYQYIGKGSLQNIMDDGLLRIISWPMRLKVAIGAAKGLNFLYEAKTPMHYSGDFKASKIMLDSLLWGVADVRVMLSGFVLPAKNWRRQWIIEDDVYNLGVVLLELLTGRPSTDKQRRGTGELLVAEMLPHLQSEDELQRVMDPELEGRYWMHEAWDTASIARRCCDPSARKRPSMREIVDDLENIVGSELSEHTTLPPFHSTPGKKQIMEPHSPLLPSIKVHQRLPFGRPLHIPPGPRSQD